MKRKLPAVSPDEIVRRYLEGEPVRFLKVCRGYDFYRLYDLLRSRGLSKEDCESYKMYLDNSKNWLNSENSRRIVALLDAGKSIREIADDLGISWSKAKAGAILLRKHTAHYEKINNDGKLRRRLNKKAKKIQLLRQGGAFGSYISRSTGLSQREVKEYLSKKVQ